jgi:tRNA(adenine34) deaminase
MGALIQARIKRLVFGAYDPKAGAVGSVMDLSNNHQLNHTIEVDGGVLEEECSGLLKTFFKARR